MGDVERKTTQQNEDGCGSIHVAGSKPVQEMKSLEVWVLGMPQSDLPAEQKSAAILRAEDDEFANSLM